MNLDHRGRTCGKLDWAGLEVAVSLSLLKVASGSSPACWLRFTLPRPADAVPAVVPCAWEVIAHGSA